MDVGALTRKNEGMGWRHDSRHGGSAGPLILQGISRRDTEHGYQDSGQLLGSQGKPERRRASVCPICARGGGAFDCNTHH